MFELNNTCVLTIQLHFDIFRLIQVFQKLYKLPTINKIKNKHKWKNKQKSTDKNSRTIGLFYFLRCGNLTNTLSLCKLTYLSSEWLIDYTLYILWLMLDLSAIFHPGTRRFHPDTGPGRPVCSYATADKPGTLSANFFEKLCPRNIWKVAYWRKSEYLIQMQFELDLD